MVPPTIKDNDFLYLCPQLRPTVRLIRPNAALARHESAGGPNQTSVSRATCAPLGHSGHLPREKPRFPVSVSRTLWI
jgi:hypothetical protein